MLTAMNAALNTNLKEWKVLSRVAPTIDSYDVITKDV
jgi:hypothetical protein